MSDLLGMDGVPKELLRAAYVRRPLYLLKVPMGFALWAATVYACYATQNTPYFHVVGVLGGLFIANIIRGLGAVGHDAVHGNCSKSKTLSYWLGLVCWAPTGMAYTLYSNYHLHHHRIANTYPDVDNFVVIDYTKNPVLAKLLLLVVYSFAYPVYFGFCMRRYVKRLTTWHKVRFNLELIGWFSLVYVAYRLLPGWVFFYGYAVPFIFGSMYASFTSMIEHYGMLPGDDAYSSRTYGTKAHLTNFIWNNVSYHNEHHKFPGIPFYNLRSFHEAAYPYYEDRVKAECYESVFALGFKLYGRILFDLDLKALEERYRGVDLAAEKAKMMQLDGISPGVAEPA